MSKIAVIGAGKTGRGFIARLLQESGKKILFIDKNEELVRKLNKEKEFEVHFFGNVRETYVISDFESCTWEDADLSDVELIFVSVGGQNLVEVGKRLGNLLDRERKLYVITAENASHPSETLKQTMRLENVSVSEATVFCTTIEDGDLNISSENYPYLQYNADLFDGHFQEIETLKPIQNFSDFLTRKLYTYNAASCVIAYLGWTKGYTNYADAANDPEILALLDKNYEVTNRVLCREFGYEPKDQSEFAALSKAKFCDRTIVDTVARNARDPQRKLADKERIIGPIRLLHKYGEDASVLEKTAAAAILYDADEQWQKLKSGKTEKEILTEFCGLKPEECAYQNIKKYLQILKG